MSAVATPERAPAAAAQPNLASGPRPFDDRATLEGRILSAWEGLVVEGRCACLVCSGTMRAGSGRAACTECGSALD